MGICFIFKRFRLLKKIAICFFLLIIGLLEISGENFFGVKSRIINNSWKKILLFYLSPRITVQNLGYSSNIYSFQAQQNSDWTADLGIDVDVSAIIKNRFILSLKARPSYSYYAENKDLESFNNDLGFTAYTYMGGFNFKYSFRMQHLKQLPTSEFGIKVRTLSQNHNFSVDWGNYRSLYLRFYVSRRDRGYDDEALYLDLYNLENTLNLKEYRGGVKVYKIIFSRTKFSLKYEYYSRQNNTFSTRDGTGQVLTLGLEFPEISSIKGSFDIGLNKFQPGYADYKDYTSLYGTGKISIRFFRRLRLSLDYQIRDDYSFWQEDQYFEQQRTGAGIAYYLTRNLRLGFYYSRNLMIFKKLEDGSETRKDEIQNIKFTIAYRIFKTMGIGVAYSQLRGDSPRPEFNRSINRIGGHITYDF